MKNATITVKIIFISSFKFVQTQTTKAFDYILECHQNSCTFDCQEREFDVEFDTGVDKFEQKKAVTGLSQSE